MVRVVTPLPPGRRRTGMPSGGRCRLSLVKATSASTLAYSRCHPCTRRYMVAGLGFPVCSSVVQFSDDRTGPHRVCGLGINPCGELDCARMTAGLAVRSCRTERHCFSCVRCRTDCRHRKAKSRTVRPIRTRLCAEPMAKEPHGTVG